MRKFALPLMLGAGLAVAQPALAQDDLGKVVTGIAQSLIAQELDKNAYAEAQSRNTAAAYRDYLQKYPKGIYKAQAERALARLGGTVTPAPEPTPAPPPVAGSAASTEAAIGLSRSDRITLQKQLTGLGYNTGGADGLWGKNTRNAIARWQSANGQTASGYLTTPQVRLIGQQAVASPGTDTPATASDDQVEERLLGLTNSERREVQRILTSLGYNTRGTDGVFGGNTRRALAAWQRDEGERASGYLTADQIRELRRQAG